MVVINILRRALCIIVPRFTPNELFLTLAMLLREERVAAWSLAVAAGE
jgi:hypothetical protein